MVTLIPQPQQLKELPGRLPLPGSFDAPAMVGVSIPGEEYREGAETAAYWLGYYPRAERDWFVLQLPWRDNPVHGAMYRERMGIHGRVEITCGEARPGALISISQAALPAERYELRITPERVRIAVGTPQGLQHAVCTLHQLARQARQRALPCLELDDWPDFPVRGLYYDVSRGRVPKDNALYDLANALGEYKLNQLQLYVEHTFQFERHPAIGRGASPLSAEAFQQLDTYCGKHGIELVPSLACFGHMSKVLSLPRYRHLAEDWGVGRYLDPQASAPEWGHGWSLAPANPQSYTFLAELFAEFLPCFSSRQFNVCCDETYDLGWGQSYELAQRIGKGRLYLNHLLKLRELAAAHGKEIMFWGDIIRSHPELIGELPRECAVLDWGYAAHMDFDRIRDFTATGLSAYACPTVSGYVTLFPRLHESLANISGWARAGREHGAAGLLNTDWGDGGHYNFTQCAWPGYLFGAEQAWNVNADRGSFLDRCCRLFLNIDSPAFTAAVVRLGDVAQTHVRGYYQSFWRHVFFARPGDDILTAQPRPASVSERGEIREQELRPDAIYGLSTLDVLDQISAAFAPYIGWGGDGWDGGAYDDHGVMDYWQFSVDTLKHAARKLALLGEGGRDTSQARYELREELGGLRERFCELWRRDNEASEIGITLALYDNAMQGLE